MLRSGPGQFHIPAAAGNMAERPGAVHHHIIGSVRPFRLHHGYSIPAQQRDRFRIGITGETAAVNSRPPPAGRRIWRRYSGIRGRRQSPGIPPTDGFPPTFHTGAEARECPAGEKGDKSFRMRAGDTGMAKNCKGSTDGGQSFSRFHRKTSGKDVFFV